MAILDEAGIREELRRFIGNKSQSEAAGMMGISSAYLSMILAGAPVSEKVARAIGYERVKKVVYEPMKGVGKSRAIKEVVNDGAVVVGEATTGDHGEESVRVEQRLEEASVDVGEKDFTLINDQECHETVVDYSDSQVWRPKKK